MDYYASLLNGSVELELPYETVDLGDLYLPTGRLYCCDPFLTDEVSMLDRNLPSGKFPVTLCVVDLPDWGKRVSLAGLRLSDERVARWTKAKYQVGGQSFSTFRVDAGLACFMDEQTAILFSDTVRKYYAVNPTGNYYDDVLAAEFKDNADPALPHHAGDWNMHVPVKGDLRNVAMFASGLGDGSYGALWGVDESDQPVIIVCDFEVL